MLHKAFKKIIFFVSTLPESDVSLSLAFISGIIIETDILLKSSAMSNTPKTVHFRLTSLSLPKK